MNRSLLLFLLALSLLFVLPVCGGGQADGDDDTSDDDDSTPDAADTDDDGDGLSESEGDCEDNLLLRQPCSNLEVGIRRT